MWSIKPISSIRPTQLEKPLFYFGQFACPGIQHPASRRPAPREVQLKGSGRRLLGVYGGLINRAADI